MLTISHTRSKSFMVALDMEGIGSARKVRLSEVIVETWKLITRLNIL